MSARWMRWCRAWPWAALLRAALLRAALLCGASTALGCSVDPYCFDCPDGGADAQVLDASEGGPEDAARPDACVPSDEVCDGADQDCDGNVDEGSLAMVGEACGTDEGECTAGRFACEEGTLTCAFGATGPAPEACDGLDNDCDGTVDDGNPEGGRACGDETGDCRAGVETCVEGRLACTGFVGPAEEICDGRDNDCDGAIDDGNPGGGEICLEGTDACSSGALRCRAGALMCVVTSMPGRETCDRIDEDCDGRVDEDFDLLADVTHCGDCGTRCAADSARVACRAGACVVAGCAEGRVDLDGRYDTGCEYACELRGSEVCNGADDDCDGSIDESLTPPAICFVAGECAGTVASCGRAAGWRCMYPATVSTSAAGDVEPEVDCDGRDNDCDGVVDDAFRDLGASCTRGVGACLTRGALQCNTAADGLACNAAEPGTGALETCNGLDDDCDGRLDEDVPEDWVTFTGPAGSVQMYRHEASRPDATRDSPGSLSHRACSGAGRIPWTNVTQPEAAAACAASGARLCTEAEWQRACETAAPTACTWSYASACTTYQGAVCNGNDRDSDTLRPGDQDAISPTGELASCFADWGSGGRVFDLSGNVSEWTAARAPGVNPLRGGSYTTPGAGLACGVDFVVADDSFLFGNVGFRCCR